MTNIGPLVRIIHPPRNKKTKRAERRTPSGTHRPHNRTPERDDNVTYDPTNAEEEKAASFPCAPTGASARYGRTTARSNEHATPSPHRDAVRDEDETPLNSGGRLAKN
jgi:hypothetical protein